MMSYSYKTWSIKTKCDLVVDYTCEVCGTENSLFSEITGVSSRNNDPEQKNSSLYTEYLTDDIVKNMENEAIEQVMDAVGSRKKEFEKGNFKFIKREKCKNCGSYQSFMPHRFALLKSLLWLSLALCLLYRPIELLLTKSWTTEGIDIFGFIFALVGSIVPIIFLIRNIKRLCENKRLKSRKNKEVLKYYFTSINIVTPEYGRTNFYKDYTGRYHDL